MLRVSSKAFYIATMDNSRTQNLCIEVKLFRSSIYIRFVIICHLKFMEKATRNFNYGFPCIVDKTCLPHLLQ